MADKLTTLFNDEAGAGIQSQRRHAIFHKLLCDHKALEQCSLL